MAQTLTIVERKLVPPPARPGIVARERLLARLRAAPTVPVVAIAAPPGYGKTTLLAQWIERDDRPAAWVSLDGRDNDPVVLLGYIAAALDRVQRLEAGLVAELAKPTRTIHDTALPRYQVALGSMTVAFVLVLDDAHALTNPEALDVVAATADVVPPGSQVAIASRDLPPLALGRLRTRGRLLEFGANDLALDAEEAGLLLREVGVPLLPDDVRRLTERTEGWAGGLYLAALSIQAAGSTAAVHASFTGTDRFVTDFLRAELLSRLDPVQLSFLRRTSVLGEMCGSLVDHVLKTTGSAARLEALERSNLFVVPLDRVREWYRYHTLFRELLAAELRSVDPALPSILLGRAADWYEAHGSPEHALTIALDAGDLDRAARILAAIGMSTFWEGRFNTLLGWIRRFGDAIDRYPSAAVIGGLAAILSGDATAAERLVEAAGRGAEPESDLVPGLPQLRAMYLRDGIAAARQDAERGLALTPPGHPLRPQSLLVLGAILEAQGDEAAAEAVFTEDTEMAAGAPGAPGRTLGLAFRARRAMDRGDWAAAESLVHRARALVRSHGLDDYASTALVAAVAARLAIHHGDRRRAAEELVHAQRLRSILTHAAPLLAVYARVEMGRAYLALGDTAGARTMVVEADEIVQVRPDLGTVLDRLADLRERAAMAPIGRGGASTLTPAELRLLPLLPTHLSYPEIGTRFGLSANTIKTQAGSIYAKLDARNRADAVDRARAVGLLEG